MIVRHSVRGADGRTLTWAWVVPVLLLICTLTIPRLDLEAFYLDEGASLFNVGALHTGPFSLTRVLEETAEHSPEQAPGWPLLLYAWGRLVGWSEPAVRTLPLLIGLLTIALVYRTGNDLFSPGVGLTAALLLGGLSLLLVYVGVARAFTMVPFFATLFIWSYWRSALRPRAPGPRALAGFFLGALGLFYSHYFGALLLPALGLYHLLFVSMSRRWWQTVLLMALAALPGLLQLPVFLQGVNRTLNNELLRTNAQGTAELFAQVLHNLGNGLINPGLTASAVLLLVVTLAVLLATCWRWRVEGAVEHALAADLHSRCVFVAGAACQRPLPGHAVQQNSLPDFIVAPGCAGGRCPAATLRASAGLARAGAPADPVAGAGRTARSSARLSRWNGLPAILGNPSHLPRTGPEHAGRRPARHRP